MKTAPHLIQYQGSKRNLAPLIMKYIPYDTKRIIEPFSGTCAVSIRAALEERSNRFLLNDINGPLIKMMELCIENPNDLADQYARIWMKQFEEGENNIDYFYKVREMFNNGEKDPAILLFLLARVVKGAVRYNDKGEMNQSCDKRRFGTKPETVQKNAERISRLLKGKCEFMCLDYKEVLDIAEPGDLIYMDPPYQGTSNKENPRDNRYYQGVEFEEFAEALSKLNSRGIDYIVSYDGMTGDKKIGFDLPDDLGLKHIYINAGTSAQSVLNGNKQTTYESLYLSKNVCLEQPERFEQLEVDYEKL